VVIFDIVLYKVPINNMADFTDTINIMLKEILDHGTSVGPFFPWHSSSDPYHWVIAELLLTLTTRRIVLNIYKKFIDIACVALYTLLLFSA